jgi:DNA-binding NarL/FixJ family response regulator
MRRVRASFENGVLILKVPFSVELDDATAIDPKDAGLTAREIAVLEQIKTGLGNKEIAHKLNMSLRTVKYHVANLLEKLGCETRAEVAYKYGHRWGS